MYFVSFRGHKIRSVAFQKLYDPPLNAEFNVDSKNGLTEGRLYTHCYVIEQNVKDSICS